MNEIEEMLEQPRVGSTKDRSRHHQDVGLLDRDELALHRSGHLGTPDCASKVGSELTQFDQTLFTRDFPGDQVHQVLSQGGRLGGALRSARDSD